METTALTESYDGDGIIRKVSLRSYKRETTNSTYQCTSRAANMYSHFRSAYPGYLFDTAAHYQIKRKVEAKKIFFRRDDYCFLKYFKTTKFHGCAY